MVVRRGFELVGFSILLSIFGYFYYAGLKQLEFGFFDIWGWGFQELGMVIEAACYESFFFFLVIS